MDAIDTAVTVYIADLAYQISAQNLAVLDDIGMIEREGDRILIADHPTIILDLEIFNGYELYEDETTYFRGVILPVPGADPEDSDDDWEYDCLHPFTGVGHEDGDSYYSVTVTASSLPDVIAVNREYEFG